MSSYLSIPPSPTFPHTHHPTSNLSNASLPHIPTSQFPIFPFFPTSSTSPPYRFSYSRTLPHPSIPILQTINSKVKGGNQRSGDSYPTLSVTRRNKRPKQKHKTMSQAISLTNSRRQFRIRRFAASFRIPSPFAM